MTTIIKQIRNYNPHIDFDDFDRKYSLFERCFSEHILLFLENTPFGKWNPPPNFTDSWKLNSGTHSIRSALKS